ncbi:MAG: three-Cys-motif partner protein TcmP [Pseudonocardia sp.]
MSANESFFARRKAAAAFKHGILAQYPPVFLAKAGSVTNGRVVFLDGYAGEGRYKDGSPGSPLLFVQAARTKLDRSVTGIFVEQDPARYSLLCRALHDADPDGTVPRVVEHGDLGELLPTLLPQAAGAALFAFLDPFGTALDVRQLREDLLGRPGRAPTEVLLHFSVSTIARMGGILNAGRARGALTIPEHKTVARADAFLGGDWWRAEFEALSGVIPDTAAGGTSWADADDSDPLPDTDTAVVLTATDVALRVARRFCERLRRETGCRAVSMPVRPEPGHAPNYVLVLFTRNEHGVWHFADALGRAGRHWQEAVHAERTRRDAARFEARLGADLGLFTLDDLAPAPPPPFDREQYERDHRARWEEAIAANLHRLFAVHGSGLRLVDHVEDVYGEVLGQAWEKHVRNAVKRLHKAGLITDDGTGREFWRRSIPVQMPRQHGPAPTTDSSRAG